MLTKEMTIETYAVGSFKKLVLRDDSGAGAVIIEQGQTEDLRIEAGPDLLRRIEVDVRNGTLRLRLGGTWLERLSDKLTTSLTRPRITYHIRAKELQFVDLTCAHSLHIPSLKTDELRMKLCGFVQAEVDALEADRLELSHSGIGVLQLTGSVHHQDVQLSGSGLYAAHALRSDDASVSISGSAQAQVYAANSLAVTIRGMGSVEYLGEPRLRQQIFGMGRVVRAN
jgi:hypothetical protein